MSASLSSRGERLAAHKSLTGCLAAVDRDDTHDDEHADEHQSSGRHVGKHFVVFLLFCWMDAVLRAGGAQQPAYAEQDDGGDGAADQTRDGGARARSSDAHPEKPEDDQPGNVDLHFTLFSVVGSDFQPAKQVLRFLWNRLGGKFPLTLRSPCHPGY